METFGHIGVYADCPNRFSDERLERTFLEKVGHFDNTKRVTQIRLIGTKLQHCLLITDNRIWSLGHNASFRCELFKYRRKNFFTNCKYIFLCGKTHLKIQLIELSR